MILTWPTQALQYGLMLALLGALAFGGIQCSQKQAARLKLAEVRREHAEILRDIAEKTRIAADKARAAERWHNGEMARIEREGERKAKEAGDAAYNRAVADVRSGRLRNVWTCPAAPAVLRAGGPSPQRDGGADDRAAAIARVLRIGAQADQRLRDCQAVIRADRKMGMAP